MKSANRGTAWVFLAKWDTTGALLWDDVEMPGGATAISGVKMRYHPYGQEVGTATANDTAKFGTYTRDAGPGLDYAMNRYYMSTWGRFTTADPYRASGGPGDPGSWNRYSYVQGDPVNFWDPSGLIRRCPAGTHSAGSGFNMYCVGNDLIGDEWEPTRYYDGGPEPVRGGGGLTDPQPDFSVGEALRLGLDALANADCARVFNTSGNGFRDSLTRPNWNC